MDAGVIQQLDKPEVIYSRPYNTIVANFIGRSNFFKGQMKRGQGNYTIEVADYRIEVDTVDEKEGDQNVIVAVRPEEFLISEDMTVAGMTADTDYTLEVSGQNITVTFKDDAIKGLAQDSKITVTYQATVTSDALTVNAAKNTATISYGNNSEFTSEPSETEVYNAKFTVTKKDGNNQPLADAGFVIKNADNKYYKLDNGVVTWVDTIDAADEHKSDAQGAVPAFTGLADGTYTLIEKTVPAGYNKAADSTFTIAKGDYTTTNLEQTATVTNNSGEELPSTGGIGTTIFYIIGAILVIGAGVVLVTRRRMNVQ